MHKAHVLSVVVIVCGNVYCVAAVVKDSELLSLGVLKYVAYLCKGCDGCCVLFVL